VLYKIFNSATREVVFEKCKIADAFFSRLKGLIGKKNIDSDSAVVFYKTSSIHTCFMSFVIDVIFLDAAMRVVKIYHNLKPWRAAFCLPSHSAIECLGGMALKKGIKVGDQLDINQVVAN
jgi:uncharacterized membrane protein (UPF0127 family)